MQTKIKILLSIHFVICLSVFTIDTFSQSYKGWKKLGDKALADKDYLGASDYYKNAMDKKPLETVILFKYAEAIRQCNMYADAEIYYQKVYDQDENEDFTDGIFWLAMMQTYNGKYTEAQKNFTSYGKITKEKSSFFAKKAKQEIKSCEYAKKLMLDSVDIRIEHISEGVNSTKAEFAPLLMDDSTLLFSSLRTKLIEGNDKEDESLRIYKAAFYGESWELMGMIDTSVNIPDMYTANGSFSPDKKRFYFSVCSEDMLCEIYVSTYNEGVWKHAVKLNEDINVKEYTTTQPMLAMVDGKEVLFFVSNRPQGKGGLDIWYCTIEQNGKKYSAPKKLDAKINSLGDEVTPFYDSKSQILYFSSNWHYGLGGFDIFKSTGGLKSLSSPDNMGYPINTSVNDFYYTINTFDTTTQKGFLVSNRKGSYSLQGETCCNDIYAFEVPEPVKTDSVKVPENPYKSLEDLNKYLPVTLYFHNDEPNPKTNDTITKFDYITTYNAYSNMKQVYQTEYAKGLSGDKIVKAQSDIDDFFTTYVDKGVSDLELFMELLIKELEKGRKIELGVKGYASPLAKSDYNVNLTLRRISSLINYMNNYENGVLLPYLNHTAQNGGALYIKKIPYGEYKADTTVSDNLNDQRNSVYSRKAALERKIEILSVSNAEKVIDTTTLNISPPMDSTTYDFGKLKPNKKYTHTFSLTNYSKTDMLILNVEPGCDCTVANWTRTSIPTGQKGKIEVVFDTTGKTGKQYKEVIVSTNIHSNMIYLNFTAEVE